MICPYQKRSPQQVLLKLLHEGNHGKQFLTRDVIVLLVTVVQLACVTDRAFFPVLNLGQNSPYRFF